MVLDAATLVIVVVLFATTVGIAVKCRSRLTR
jgi:hypothetical protein